MAVTNREQLSEYILRKLGAPIIQVNVHPDQLEDRIDEAIAFFHQYYQDFSMLCYQKQRITASELHCVEADALSKFKDNDVLVGETSGATTVVSKFKNTNTPSKNVVYCYKTEGEFLPNEKVTLKSDSSVFVTLRAENPFVEGIYDGKQIALPNWILGVTRILPMNVSSSSFNLFDYEYQVRNEAIYDLMGTQVMNYEMVMNHLQLLSFELNSQPSFQFSRLEGVVIPQIRWDYDVNVGDYFVLECYRMLDPKMSSSRIFDDIFFKRYCVALVKKQWGVNLKKYQGIQLPGGVTLDGQQIFAEGEEEIRSIEEQLMNMIPASGFIMG